MIGLSIGIASCLVIMLYVSEHISYDKFWKDYDKIYRINTFWNTSEGETRFATSPPPLAEAINQDIPGVEATRLYTWSDFTFRPDTDSSNVFRETGVYAANHNFFKIFSNLLIEGDPESALKEPVSIVISESTAKRYFGKEMAENKQVLGKNILGGKDGGTLWKITGIMKNMPHHTHLDFGIIISSNSYPDDLHRSPIWTWNSMHTYIKVVDGVQIQDIENNLDQIVQSRLIPFMGADPENFNIEGNDMKYVLQPIEDIHLKSNFLREMGSNGDIKYITIFFLVAIIILVIACVNFINLTTAQAAKRAKEVGIRKSLGSQKSMLRNQFLLESMIFSLTAGILALGLVELFNILAKDKIGLDFSLSVLNNPVYMLLFLGIILIVGFLAGAYPSFYLTAFKPVDVLKGKITHQIKTGGLRNGLVVFQFMVSVFLIIATGVISDQVEFFRNKNLGFNKENVLIIQNDREIEESREDFKASLKKHSVIINASFSSGIPAIKEFHVRDYSPENDFNSTGFNWYQIDESYIETMDMELVSGRSFTERIASDSNGIILNQAAVAELGLQDPMDQLIVINRGAQDEHKVRVIGVVKDFNFESFKNKIKPLGMEYMKGYVFKDYISIRIVEGKESEAVKIIKKEWENFEPDVPISYNFLDSNFDNLFKDEQRLSTIFSMFTGLAVLIACMGLLGLTAYATEQRKKEIGIRKVLGATISNLITLLSWNFGKMAIVGFILAVPVAYFAMEKWLATFEYKTSISSITFLSAGVSTLIIALFTISFLVVKAAFRNVVEALKEE